MTQYRRKEIYTARQWQPHEDDPVVQYPIHPAPAERRCRDCGKMISSHGHIPEPQTRGHIVCPGDWVIEGPGGKVWPEAPEDFEKKYEALSE